MAAIQLIVYAGAVVVLFVFVIMLLGPDAGAAPAGIPKARLSRTVAGVLIALLAAGAGVLVLGVAAEPAPWVAVPEGYGGVEAVGSLLFGKGIVPFELATALLIVAVVGAIAVDKSKPPAKPKPVVDNPTKRLFHGPLHPRDAGRALPKESA
jgi:NADH-quinone oxidoreductase subunit J